MNRWHAAAVAANARSMLIMTSIFAAVTAGFQTAGRLAPTRQQHRPLEVAGAEWGKTQVSQGRMRRWWTVRPPRRVARNPLAHGQREAEIVPRERSARQEGFDVAKLTGVLVNEHRGNLVRLAQKYGELVDRAEDVETISITKLDGDHMQLDVVYCDHGEQTCVAVAVPIAFPHHCDDGACVIDAIHELEEMEDMVAHGGETKPSKKLVSPELMEAIARICVVMNRDFQDELVGFVRAFGGRVADKPLGSCEMVSLTPDGFKVQAALLPNDPVSISFSRECLSAKDIQREILHLSEQALVTA